MTANQDFSTAALLVSAHASNWKEQCLDLGRHGKEFQISDIRTPAQIKFIAGLCERLDLAIDCDHGVFLLTPRWSRLVRSNQPLSS
jgi:hypothetical protein